MEGSIKTVTIQRDVNHWYVGFSVERRPSVLPISPAATGIEVGLNSFAVLSDGGGIDNPRQLERGLAHLRRCQRKLAWRKRGSKRSPPSPRFWLPKHTARSGINAPRSTTMSAVGWWSGTA